MGVTVFTRDKVLCGVLFFRHKQLNKTKIPSAIRSSKGNATTYVLAILFVSSIFVTTLYRSLHSEIDSEERINSSDVYDIATNALIDYVIVSVKSQWCIGDNWTKEDCTNRQLNHSRSIRRMLISENSIMALGDYFIRNVIEFKTETTDSYPSCVSTLLTKPSQNELADWKDRWLKCIRLPPIVTDGPSAIQLTIADLTDLPSNHPLSRLFSNDYFKQGNIGKAIITVSQIDSGRQFPRNGREITLDIRVEVFRKSNDSPAGKVVSKVEVIPSELNHFGLILAGDLYMDGTSLSQKGGYIPLANDNPKWPGINFDSPVYIDGNIIIPTEDKTDKSSFVRFNSNVYLSTKTSTTNENGAICQGYSDGNCEYFVSTVTNKLANYMNGFAKGLDHMLQDEGVDYIPGPNLKGKADGDSSKGGGVQTCADIQKALTDFRYTNENKMLVLKDAAVQNQYTLMWTNDASSSFNQKYLNRFSTPHNDIPRGEEASCFEAQDSGERLMRPHIYNNNNATQIPGRRNRHNRAEPVQLLPAYNLYTLKDIDLTSTADSLNEDLLIQSPIVEFDSDAAKTVRNSLKKCPKNRNKDQIDALDGDFKEKAAVVANTEYGIVLKDSSNVQQTLTDQTEALKAEDRPAIRPTMTNEANTGVINYLEQIFPTTGDGTMYVAKSLMAVNTKLVFQGIKDGLIDSLLEEFDDTISGTFANEAKQRLTRIETLIKNLLGITNISQEATTVSALRTQLTNLNTQLTTLNRQISRTSPTVSDTTCTTDPITSTESCTTTTSPNPVYTALLESKATLETQIANLDTKLADYSYLVARRNSINALISTMATIQTDLVDLMGADALGQSFTIEEVGGIKARFSTGDKEFFAPNVLKMRINLPRITNQFVTQFLVRVDAFDPSYVYTKKPDITSAEECSALEVESGIVAIWALTTEGNRACLELRSTRLSETGTFPNPGYNVFNYQFHKTSSGTTSNIAPAVVNDPQVVSNYIDSYTDFALYKHPGFNEFKCKITSTKAFVPDELSAISPGAENLDLAGDNSLSEQGMKSERFAIQTNHSWYFTPDTPFMDVASSSYDTNNPEGLLDITVNTTGPEFPVKSIMSRCLIRKTVTFVAGFYVCRELIIEGGRSSPLEIAGTFIAGRMEIPDSTIAQHGLYFRNIYHQVSVRNFREVNLLNTEASCYDNITQPIWYGNLSDSNQLMLDRCVPSTFRDDAQAFTWNLVDPDCGIINKFSASENPAVVSERMACKDEVQRYFIVEKGRGSL